MAVILALSLGSCGQSRPTGTIGHVAGFAGMVAADEPRAALVGRDVLSAGGRAADAAIAMAFTLSATLPSQASLGAGGVCLVYDHGSQTVETLDFTAPPQATPVPAMARGLYALYARYGGGLPWEQLVSPAEAVARLGQPVSRALARRLAAWPSGEIDSATKAVFFRADGRPLSEGEMLLQPALGSTLARLRLGEAAALYDGKGGGDLARALSIDSAALRAFVPQWRPAARQPGAGEEVYLALPATGTEGEAGLKPAGGLAALLAQLGPAQPQSGSTGLAVLGRDGSAVACDFSLGRMFGSGHLAADFGLFAAGGALPPLHPLMAIGGGQLRLALAAPAAGVGQTAPQSLAAIACQAGPDADSCRAASDPRGAGLAGAAGE